MNSLIVVHPRFDAEWPFAADALAQLWRNESELRYERIAPDDARPLSEIVPNLENVTRLAALRVPVARECVEKLSGLREAYLHGDENAQALLQSRGVKIRRHPTEGFWAQSVAEFALGLTICALRRIPQTYAAMQKTHDVWNYTPPGGVGKPGLRGVQFGDDARFSNGTIAGKRVRIVGAGNIATRYATWTSAMGADVAMWDPLASEPCFHRSGARREYSLSRLARDAEIFAPMLPLLPSTEGLVTGEIIAALPQGCLVILATRALICDMNALRKRVLADEVALAADVFDIEPLPLDDALLGRHNVVHTPHNAGRTRDANESWARALAQQFDSVE